MLIYVFINLFVNILYTDMVKLNTQTPQDSPYTFLQMFLLLLENFEILPRKILAWLAQTIFFWQLLLCYYSEQLKFQFIHSSDTSRSRFVMAFCPCSTPHFSGKPVANGSFGSNFDFALPRLKITEDMPELHWYIRSVWGHSFMLDFVLCTYKMFLIHYLNFSAYKLQHAHGPYIISRFILFGMKTFATFDGFLIHCCSLT